MRPVFITRVCGLLVVVLLAAGAVKGVLAAVEPILKVTVQTVQKSVKNGGFLPLVMNIQNIGDAIQTLHVWSCSQKRNWKTDNPFIWVVGGPCKKDVLRGVKLEAGETYTQALHVGINVQAREDSLKSLSFRLGFTDGDGSNERLTAWSNPITINITE